MKAFPTVTTNNEGNEVYCGGMDLRDYFAAKAMQGIISTSASPCFVGLDDGLTTLTASTAYRVADAMMKAREL